MLSVVGTKSAFTAFRNFGAARANSAIWIAGLLRNSTNSLEHRTNDICVHPNHHDSLS